MAKGRGGGALQAPRGTRDFYPEDMRQRNRLFGQFRETALAFGFEEVDAPMVEHLDLFRRKAGEEILDQLYHFTLHDRELALRAEMTPSIARMVIARQGAMRFPIRWFTVTQNWRYERMTRGRKPRALSSGTWTSGGSPASRPRPSSCPRCSACPRRGRAPPRARSEDPAQQPGAPRGVVCAPACSPIAPGGLRAALRRDRQDRQDRRPRSRDGAALSIRRGAGRPQRRARRSSVLEVLAARSLDDAARFTLAKDSTAIAELRRASTICSTPTESPTTSPSTPRWCAASPTTRASSSRPSTRAARCGPSPAAAATTGWPRRSVASPCPAVGFGFGDVVIGELLQRRGPLARPSGAEIDDVVFAFGPDGEARRRSAWRQRLRASGTPGRALRSVKCEAQAGARRRRRQAGAERVYLIGERRARAAASSRSATSPAEGGARGAARGLSARRIRAVRSLHLGRRETRDVAPTLWLVFRRPVCPPRRPDPDACRDAGPIRRGAFMSEWSPKESADLYQRRGVGRRASSPSRRRTASCCVHPRPQRVRQTSWSERCTPSTFDRRCPEPRGVSSSDAWRATPDADPLLRRARPRASSSSPTCFGDRRSSDHDYAGRWRGVYPIKVNQQAHVVEEIVEYGAPFGVGLEAGSKPELLVRAGASRDPTTRCSSATATRTAPTSRRLCSPSASAAPDHRRRSLRARSRTDRRR